MSAEASLLNLGLQEHNKNTNQQILVQESFKLTKRLTLATVPKNGVRNIPFLSNVSSH